MSSLARDLIQLPRRARWRLRGAQVTIDPTATVNARRVSNLGRRSTFRVGAQSLCHADIAFDREEAVVEIGRRTFVGRSSLVSACRISIGDDILISWGATIVDHDSHHPDFAKRRNDVVDWGRGEKDWTHVAMAPVRIEDKVWIGFNAIVLKGVTVGTGSVVAAGAIVTRDVPPWTVVAGAPARVVNELEPVDA
jgi:acetyltransferase-like isoleucine patch superfamily enzyme